MHFDLVWAFKNTKSNRIQLDLDPKLSKSKMLFYFKPSNRIWLKSCAM